MCFQHSALDGQPFAASIGADHVQILMLAGKALCDLMGSIRAVIFDDPYFRFIILLVKKSKRPAPKLGAGVFPRYGPG